MNLPLPLPASAIKLRGGHEETVLGARVAWEDQEQRKVVSDRENVHRPGEKQILVDPISLTRGISSSSRGKEYGNGNIHHPHPPAVTTQRRIEEEEEEAVLATGKTGKFMSSSLPNSASSSPRFVTRHKKKCRNLLLPLPPPPLARQHSVALTNLERLRESHLMRMRRSKSCGDGRACQPSVDFDIWSAINRKHQGGGGRLDQEDKATIMFSQQPPPPPHKFKCGTCLFLPGFGGRGKAVKARRNEPNGAAAAVSISNIIDGDVRVSLERFECGSWRSSAVISYYEDIDGGGGDDHATAMSSSNLFFDLPVELIGCSSSGIVNDMESPVTTGFMFDHTHTRRSTHKGVLKNTRITTTTTTGTTNPTPPPPRHSSSSNVVASTSTGVVGLAADSNHSPRRHVRFSSPGSGAPCSSSTSSSSSSPPLLLLCNAHALDNGGSDGDLSAFLEAQSA
ncbi:uncharacterized protein LOC127249666 [Andrographis paniculata]|uniref:uncharacterized protein LOC127249666 n=1 Tax=Andrographis paniculata TaxID=175694 RepID=UPI0021E79F45|nr:uncharacterized protein LOC127249666 [Andrographis paniculata]